MVQLIHWLAVDEFLLLTTFEALTIVYRSGGRVAAI